MDYIKRIRIVNFQSIRDLTLELSPTTTAITGPNDLGKSAIFRAIKVAILNRMSPNWVTHGADVSMVEIETTNGLARWIRKNDKNFYELESPVGTLTHDPWQAGREVPDEISAFLRMSPVKAGDDAISLNMVGQWDPPFLVSKSGPVISQVLGKLSGIDDVLASLREVAREIRDKHAHQNFLQDEINTLNQEIKQDENSQKTKKQRWDQIDGIYQSYCKNRSSLQELTAIWSKLTELKRQYQEKKARLSQIFIPDCDGLIASIEGLQSKLMEMRHIRQQLVDRKKQLDQAKQRLQVLPDLMKVGSVISSLDNSLDRLEFLKISQSQVNIKQSMKEMAIAQERQLSEDLDSASGELAKFDTCPLCGNSLQHAHV